MKRSRTPSRHYRRGTTTAIMSSGTTFLKMQVGRIRTSWSLRPRWIGSLKISTSSIFSSRRSSSDTAKRRTLASRRSIWTSTRRQLQSGSKRADVSFRSTPIIQSHASVFHGTRRWIRRWPFPQGLRNASTAALQTPSSRLIRFSFSRTRRNTVFHGIT